MQLRKRNTETLKHRRTLLVLVVLTWLWFRLIDHLRLEWSVNPQYAYGWAVPFLCVYLWWRGAGGQKTEDREQPRKGSGCRTATEIPKYRSTETLAFWLLAFAYLPTRLVQQANPEWRLVSWALAVEVIGLTVLVVGGSKTAQSIDHSPSSVEQRTIDHRPWTIDLEGKAAAPAIADAGSKDSVGSKSRRRFRVHGLWSMVYGPSWPLFPLLFFFVAVPWPTVIEGPLIQGLTRANAAAAVELLSLIGVPAIQHGNLIEVGTGVIGIDEACSGIRSFQAAFMISLFFGELYRLTVRRRLFLCLLGFLLSFLFNVARTTLLTWVAAARGTAALGSWHDPAGVVILVGCFVCLWVLSLALARGRRSGLGGRRTENGEPKPQVRPRIPGIRPLSSVFCPLSSALCLAWLLFSDVATELWYRAHERHLPPPVTWTVQFPRNNPSFRELPLAERTRQFLRFDEGVNGCWGIDQSTEHRGQRTAPNAFGVQDGQTRKTEGRTGGLASRKVQAIFLRWKPGRTAVHLAKTHTPEACVTAGGRELVSKSEVRLFKAGGLELPFRSYVFKDVEGPLHVYYCLWEDRGGQQGFDSSRLTYGNRLEPVLAGRRLAGQRSLELAIWGCGDEEKADVVAGRELGKIINSKF